MAIRQIDTDGMTNEEKAAIDPVNRLRSAPTSAEARYLAVMAKGLDAMGTPEYDEACKALDEERRRAHQRAREAAR